MSHAVVGLITFGLQTLSAAIIIDLNNQPTTTNIAFLQGEVQAVGLAAGSDFARDGLYLKQGLDVVV